MLAQGNLASAGGSSGPAAGDTQAKARRPSSVWELFPSAEFYPQYIADPIRAQSALMLLHVPSSTIPDTGDGRFSLRLGGRFPICRLHPADDPDRGWQLDFEGGFFGHFDRDHSLDSIGWDGIYGLLLSFKPSHRLAFRVGALHDSAHIGDEYAERTGRTRVGSTREELVAGVSWRLSTRWRVYLEGGTSYATKEFQERLRGQGGVEYLGEQRWRQGRMGWYAALDLRAWEENSWKPRVTGQAGLLFPTGRGTSRYRIALELARGRSVLGEFYTDEETYFGLGWYFDF